MDTEHLLNYYRQEQVERESQQQARNRDILRERFEAHSKKLSLFFASLCVIDLFGVFPIVALPRSLILCGEYLLDSISFIWFP